MKNNITLIGMPGSGKSTVGVVLAKRLGRRFVDSDLVIRKDTVNYCMNSSRNTAWRASGRSRAT